MRVRIDGVQKVGAIKVRTLEDRSHKFDCAEFLTNNRHAKDYSRQSETSRSDLRIRLRRTAERLIAYGRLVDAERLLFDFDYLSARIALEPSLRGIIEDLSLLEVRLQAQGASEVRTLRRTLQLSEPILTLARDQFPEQTLARLSSLPDEGRIGKLCLRARGYKTATWLRPLSSGLENADSPLEATLEFREELLRAATFDNSSKVPKLQPSGHAGFQSPEVGACYEPGGARLWTVGDSQLVGWDPSNRKALVRFRLNNASPTAVASNGVTVAVTTREGPVLLFDSASGSRLEPLPGHGRATLDGTFLNDDLLVTVGTDGFIRIWDVRERREKERLSDGRRSLHCVLHLGMGLTAVGGESNGPECGSIQIWDIATGSRLGSFGEHSWPVEHLAVDESGAVLAAGANDELNVWRLADRTHLRRIAIAHTKCHALAFVAPGVLASGDSGGEVRILDIDSGEEVRRLPAHGGLVSALCVDPSARRFVTTSWDQTVRIWNADRVATPRPTGHTEQVTSLAYFPGETHVVSASQDGTLIIWDAHDGRSLGVLRGHEHWVSAVWAGAVVVSASWDGTLRVWNPETRECLAAISTGDEHVVRMACDADGTKAATVSSKGAVRVWDLVSRTLLATSTSPEPEVRSVAFLGRDRLRWGTHRRQVFDWSMDNQNLRASRITGTVPATTWELAECSGLSALGSADGGILLFDRDGKTMEEFGVAGCGPSAIARSADGQTLLAAGGLPQIASDNTARLWNTSAPGRPVASFLIDAPCTAAALSQSGERAVLGDASGAVHFLECVRPAPGAAP